MRNGTHFFGGWNHQTIRVEGRISTIEMTVKIAAPRWLFIGSLLPKIVRRLDEITFEIGTPQKKTLVCDPRIDDWWARHLDRFGHIKILKKLGYYCICYYGVYQSLPWCMVVFATAMCDNSQFFLFFAQLRTTDIHALIFFPSAMFDFWVSPVQKIRFFSAKFLFPSSNQTWCVAKWSRNLPAINLRLVLGFSSQPCSMTTSWFVNPMNIHSLYIDTRISWYL